MSYIVAIKRVITKHEILELIKADSSLRIIREDLETIDLAWLHGGDETFFQLVQGELQATTPSTSASEKLASIATALQATVVGEEDLIPQSSQSIQRGVFTNRSTWVGWPLIVVILSALLAWRW